MNNNRELPQTKQKYHITKAQLQKGKSHKQKLSKQT